LCGRSRVIFIVIVIIISKDVIVVSEDGIYANAVAMGLEDAFLQLVVPS
jgi:hypothetical protein